MRDLALDPQTGDLALTAGRATLTSGLDAIRQRLVIRFRLWKGEWYRDTSVGVPYRERILVKNPDRTVVEGVLRSVITTAPGIVALSAFTLAIRSDRRASVSFEAQTDTGEVLSVTDFVAGVL